MSFINEAFITKEDATELQILASHKKIKYFAVL